MANSPKEFKLEVEWPEALTPVPVSVFRITRIGHDVQIRAAYADIAPIVDAIAAKKPEGHVKVQTTVDLIMGSQGFYRLYQQVTTIYEAMKKSGQLPPGGSTE